MIYFTGDTHGEQLRFVEGNMTGEPEWTENDYLIVCGDFGFIFRDSPQENLFLDYLENKPYTICFCDGNHENFTRIYQYPEEIWNGGRVHKIRRNIYHLMRGNIFTIDGHKIFAMGGAYSRDKYMREEGYSWWRQELPTNAEYHEAIKNLEEHNKQVDYIITHTAPSEIIYRMGKCPDEHDKELTGFLEWVMHEVKFRKWFFGHWHLDCDIIDNFRAIYYDVVGVEKDGEDF